MEKTNVAIIGGGASGVMVAHTVRKRSPNISITIFDPAAELGLGLAYGKAARGNILNVRGYGMSPVETQPNLFAEWLDKHRIDPHSFAKREKYAEFFKEWSQETIQSIRWVKSEIVAIEANQSNTFHLKCADKSEYDANQVVLALGQPKSFPISTGTNIFNDPWDPKVYENLSNLKEILILGTALSAVDVALEFFRSDFKGEITMMSRHGFLPASHADLGEPIFPRDSAKRINTLFSWFRDSRKDNQWRERIEGFRSEASQIWRSLSVKDQKRFILHLRPFWAIHRHRIPQESLSYLMNQRELGRLKIVKDSIKKVEGEDPGVTVALVSGKLSRFDRVINCTGAARLSRCSPVLIEKLISTGLARLDVHGIGLDVDENGYVLSKAGVANPRLFCIGSLRRGVDLESVAIRELRKQALRVAELVG